MFILNKPFSKLMFSDIEQFCETGEIEGIQLDYKKDIPSSGLAKHFASFSNSRGGIIIVGVEEDDKGAPKLWEGLSYESKLIDKIHQYASNVMPKPIYTVRKTDEVNGKVFILIQILEGDMSPYYVFNDANLYVRTGNITSLIDKASPDMAELLFGKKEKAKLLRNVYLSNAQKVYNAALQRAEKERQKLILEEREKIKEQHRSEGRVFDPNKKYVSNYFQGKVGTSVSMCSVLIQPFTPSDAFVSPAELRASVNEVVVDSHNYHAFPSMNNEPIPQGILSFEWNRKTGDIITEQLYGTGLVYYARDVMRQEEDRIKKIYISSIAAMIFSVLRAGGNIYNKFGYQGGIKGEISLKDTTDVSFIQMVPSGWNGFFHSSISSLLSEYSWELDLDTTMLNDKQKFVAFFIDKVREIHWDLGFGEVRDDLIKAFLENNLGFNI